MARIIDFLPLRFIALDIQGFFYCVMVINTGATVLAVSLNGIAVTVYSPPIIRLSTA